MNVPTLYLMAGYPGAGKTTIAKIIAQKTGAAHLSSDAIRLELFPQPQFTPEEHATLYTVLDARTEELLSQGKSVIYDANLNRRQHRDDKYKICEQTGATPKLLWIETPRTLAKERATHNSRSPLVPRNETLETMFDRIADVIEPPSQDEAAIVIDGTNTSEELVAQALQL